MKVELISITPDAERHIERCARVSYASEHRMGEDSHVKLLTTLLKLGHLSVFEHAYASFVIDGISRACSHQLVRHRLASYTQESQRYVEQVNSSFVVPKTVSENSEADKLFREFLNTAKGVYEKLINLGIPKEDARFVLPMAVSTRISMTANFREYLHIIDLRVSREAQWEIRDVFVEVWKQLYKQSPTVFGLKYFERWSSDFEYKRQIFEKEIREVTYE